MDEDKPTIVDKIVNFTKASIEHAKSGFSKVDNETYKERLNICSGCTEYYNPNNGNPICNHKNCGCFLLEKASWSTQSCPIGKWAAKDEVSGSFTEKIGKMVEKISYIFPVKGCCGSDKDII